ncbi:hypothetical protein BDP81DRAFT_436082 [Colletotrichum phormii]|uniref:Uncharacterized protein n=1 Tax=Colletotrichum phormii TaxID=359342 RepID=A0AAJ0ECY1_9PEZI|nr:uncharacterized protein BDP81DRAFT_436082 [Colletotrichum phormii]KAK1625067.1 hypothetical protein BDP81DRAFT_436082 [Colletotrichum phormii]
MRLRERKGSQDGQCLKVRMRHHTARSRAPRSWASVPSGRRQSSGKTVRSILLGLASCRQDRD